MNSDNIIIADHDIVLESGEPLQAEHSPVLRVMIAVFWMGVLAGVMGAFAALFAIVSAGKGGDRLMWSVCGAAVCGVVLVILSAVDRRKQREFEDSQKAMLGNAAVFRGKITCAKKYVKTIAYANQIFEEITWRFCAEYKDENNNTAVCESGRYINDISKSLHDLSVDILKKENGECVFGELHTAKKGETVEPLDVVVAEE